MDLEKSELNGHEALPAAETAAITSKINNAIKLVERYELFHTFDKEAYITINEKNRNITFPIRSETFNDWFQQHTR